MASLGCTSAGAASVTTTVTPVKTMNVKSNIWVLSAPGAAANIGLEPASGPNSSAGTATGAATVTIGLGFRQATTATAHGVATVAPSIGKYFYPAEASAGAGGVLSNNLQIIRAANNFTIYTSHPPYPAQDVLIAPSSGIGAAQGFQMTSAGVASGSWTLGTAQKLRAQSDGIGHVTAAEQLKYSITTTSRGAAAFTKNYLSSPFHLAATSAGKAGCTGNYLAGPVPYTAAAHGVAAFTKNYLSSPARLTLTAAGRAGCTSNYIAAPVRLASTSAGRAGCTSNYLASPVRGFSAASHGVAAVQSYLAGPTFLYARTSLASGAGATWYLAGPVALRTTARGVSTASFYVPVPDMFTTARGVGHATIDLAYVPGPFVTSRANGVATVSLYETGRVYLAVTSRGVGGMRDNPAPKFQCHAGCNAYSEQEPLFSSNNQYQIFNDSIYHAQVSGPYVNIPSGGGRRYGVFAYLSSPVGLDNSSESTALHGRTKMAGVATASLYQPGDLRFVCDAGCRAFTAYRSDEDPQYFSHVSNPQGPYSPSVQGVKIYQTGRTYLSARVNTYLEPPRFGRGLDRWSLASDHNRLVTRSDGVAGVAISERFSDRTFFNGVADVRQNNLNVPSYNLQAFTARGVGNFSMLGIGRTELTTTSRGVASSVLNYLSSPVYLTTTSDGVSGPNHIDAYGFYQQWTARAGCYPYTIAAHVDPITGDFILQTTYPGVQIDMERPAPSFTMRARGLASVTIEIKGVPLFDLYANGRARTVWTLQGLTKFLAATSHGVGNMTATAFQAHDWQSDGIGHMVANLTRSILQLSVTHADGVATFYIAPPPTFDMHTLPNGFQYVGGLSPYAPGGRLVYTPDAWRMRARYALYSRVRGQSRFDSTMYMSSVFGNLLWRYWSTQRPDAPDIDGQPNAGYGQYWPRQLKLPYNQPRTPYPYWYDYEYARR